MMGAFLVVCTTFVVAPLIYIALVLLEIRDELRTANRLRHRQP